MLVKGATDVQLFSVSYTRSHIRDHFRWKCIWYWLQNLFEYYIFQVIFQGTNLQLERLCSMDTPPPPPPPPKSWLPIRLSHIGSQVKKRQSQSYKFKEFAKISNSCILEQTLPTTHLLKLLDKMCKYEIDLASIVEDTEGTQFYPQTDRRTDGQGQTSIPLFNFVEAGV